MIAIIHQSDSEISVFQELGLKPVHKKHLNLGDTLFARDAPVANFYALDSGRIRLSRMIADGRLVTFYQVRRGQFFAEASLFSETYHCEAVATEPSVVLAYSKTEFLNALKANPDFAFSYMAHLARQVQSQRAQMEVLHIKSAAERLLAYIQNQISAGEDTCDMGATWKDIAAEVNLTHEAVYRALRVLEKNGAIIRDGQRIRIGRL